MSVPACSESTTPIPGVEKPDRTMSRLMNGTRSLTSSGVSNSAGSPHDPAEAIRRFSSSTRSGVRATSMPPLCVNTPSSLYWRMVSWVHRVMSLEWSTGNRKFEAWLVDPPGLGSGPFSSRTMSRHPSLAR